MRGGRGKPLPSGPGTGFGLTPRCGGAKPEAMTGG